jgi:hypothetical protein
MLCSRCSELNTPAREGFLKKKVTECRFSENECGKVGGDFYYQDRKGAGTCEKCKNSGTNGGYGCNEKNGKIQCYGVSQFCRRNARAESTCNLMNLWGGW